MVLYRPWKLADNLVLFEVEDIVPILSPLIACVNNLDTIFELRIRSYIGRGNLLTTNYFFKLKILCQACHYFIASVINLLLWMIPK